MRNLSAAALTKLSNRFGNEPIIIIDVAWNTGNVVQYAERQVEGIKGRILEVTNLDNVITVSRGNDSQELTVTLDDTDSTIKGIMNINDIHKRDVWVYQWFEGLDLTDRFLLFRGKISTPIVWKEGDRTVTFTIITQLEDKEVGFSPEEGQFPFIPKDLVGKTWPSIFGTPLDVPAVRIGAAITGTLLCGVGVLSGQDAHRNEPLGGNPPDLSEQSLRVSFLSVLSNIFTSAAGGAAGFRYPGSNIKLSVNEDYKQRADEYRDEANKIRENMAQVTAQYLRAQRCARCRRTDVKETAEENGLGCNPVTILGGEDFPRGEITLAVGSGGRIRGSFEGETNVFHITSRWHPENDTTVLEQEEEESTRCPDCDPQPPEGKNLLWEADVPNTYGNTGPYYNIYREKILLLPGQGEGVTYSRQTSKMLHFWADAGSTVRLADEPPFTHIVSIVSGTVLQVKAFKSFHGDRRLVNIPTDLWTATTATYGSITAEQVVVEQLTSIEDQEWDSDDVYVTFESDVGPNIVDIITYIIQTYSDLEIDSTSFDAVKIKLEPFPANFALLERKNLVSVLQEIAFQARCSLQLKNGIFYLKYLAEEPTTIDTITENDIEHQSVEVSLTSTEDLVTKYTALWRLSYAQEELDKIILRHNIEKYGVQEEEYEYYIYNQPDITHKVATFWLIRKSNSWKHITFKTFLHKLNLETMDAITLNFRQSYVSTGTIKAFIERADFDSQNQTIAVECWLPIKSGEMEKYEFAWPANVDADLTFPTAQEITLGLAGGNGIGKDATGELPVGDTTRVGDQAIFIGGINIVFAGQTDRGDNHPSDIGFTAQELGPFNTYADIVVESKPNLNLDLNYAEDIDAGSISTLVASVPEIILERTKVKSIRTPGQWNSLADILIATEGKPLAIKTASLFCGQDGGCKTSPFDFKYNTEHSVWAAGSAFLAEEDAPPLAGSQNGELLGECE